MTYYEILYTFSIGLMIVTMFIITAMIANMRYSLYTCIGQAVYYGNLKCIKWLMDNPRYIFYHIFLVCITGIGLSNLGQLLKEDIFTRTIFVQHSQPLFWICLTYIAWDYKRVYELLKHP